MEKNGGLARQQFFITVMRWVIAAVIPVLYKFGELSYGAYDNTAVAVYLGVTAVLTVCSLKRVPVRPVQWVLIGIIDSLTVSFVILTGKGFGSECFSLYYLVFLQAGMVLGPWHVAGAVLLSNVLYTGTVFLSPFGGQEAGTLVTRLIFTWLVGSVVSYMSHLGKKYRREAITDYVTCTYNRSFLEKTLQHEFARARRNRSGLSLVMIDIDNFKQVNDIYGHKVGDMVLERVAGVIQANIREVDFLARYGGEEFLVALPGTGPEKAVEVAERIRNAVETASYNVVKDLCISVTISCGVSSYPFQARSLEELLGKADECLYKAKRSGRNMVYQHAG